MVENVTPLHDDAFSTSLAAPGVACEEDSHSEPPECMRLVCEHLREVGGDVIFGYNEEKDALIYNKNRKYLAVQAKYFSCVWTQS